MPFPAILPLDYHIRRAQAWLEALKKASSCLPAQALGRLWDMDCNTETGRLALASLLFPVEAATPDISSSRNIEVFLENRQDLPARADQILEHTELFLLQLSLTSEMRNILEKLESLRPKSVDEAEGLVQELHTLAGSLELIWNISRRLQKGENIAAVLDGEAPNGGPLLAATIRTCERRLEARENQAALSAAEDALMQLEQNDMDKLPEILKKYLHGRVLRLRGLAHWRQNQLALAEKDLSRAASLLKETGLPPDLKGGIFLELGALKQARRDMPGMCSAYREACALGFCAPLAASRRQGLCQDNIRP